MKRQRIFLTRVAAVLLILWCQVLWPKFAMATHITGFQADSDTQHLESGEIGANDNVTIMVDIDDGSAGQFIVQDYDGGSPTVNVIVADAQNTTIGSDAFTVNGTTSLGGTLGVAGMSTLNGINNGGDGITNAGAISEVTTITGTTASFSDLNARDDLAVTDDASIGGTLTVTGGLNNNSGGITNTGTVSGATTLSSSADMTIWAGMDDNGGAGDLILRRNDGGDSVYDSYVELTSSAINMGGEVVNIADGLTADSIHISDTNSGTNSISGVTSLSAGSATLSSTLGVSGNLTATGTTNTIGTAGSSANTLTGATNTITGVTTVTSTGTDTANQMIVDATSSRFVSADTFSNTTVSDGAVSLVADSDALSTNARSGLSMAPTSASLLVNTDSGESHGVSISQTSTVISGGTDSTTLTLDDDGAKFADEDTGAPVKVTGVANGVGDYDAVNMRQYRRLDSRIDRAYSGIASVAALAAIPAPVQGKNLSVGLGFGNFENQNALALGGKALIGKKRDITLTAGVGYCDNTATISAGVGWSF